MVILYSEFGVEECEKITTKSKQQMITSSADWIKVPSLCEHGDSGLAPATMAPDILEAISQHHYIPITYGAHEHDLLPQPCRYLVHKSQKKYSVAKAALITFHI